MLTTRLSRPACPLARIPRRIALALVAWALLIDGVVPTAAQVRQFSQLFSIQTEFPAQIVSAAGDVNADGYPDVILGTWGARADGSATVLVLGGPVPSTRVRPPNLGGPVPIDVTGGRDYTGDGRDDVVINEVTDGRRVWVYPSGWILGPGIELVSNREGSRRDVSTGGDFNADGFGDILLGEPLYSGSNDRSGRVSIYFGGPNLGTETPKRLIGPGPDSVLGALTGLAGDVNGDGFDDFFATRRSTSWRRFQVDVFFGGTQIGPLASFSLLPPMASHFDRGSVSAAGDFNGDGFADVVVGDASAGSAGAAYLYLGSSNPDGAVDATFVGQQSGARLGVGVSRAGDINQDGYDDIVVADDDGTLHIYLGGNELDTESDAALPLPEFDLAGEWAYGDVFFPQFVTNAGDFDANGLPDIVVSSGTTTYVFGPKCPPATPCILSFEVEPSAVFPGDSATLTWMTSGNPDLEISLGVGPVDSPSGQVAVVPARNSTYRLTATNGAGFREAKASVRWKTPSATLESQTPFPFPGSPFLLTARIEGADSATISGLGAIPAQGGSFEATVANTTTFVLTATNAVGSTTSEFTIDPQAPQIEGFKANPEAIIAGEFTSLSWSVPGADQVLISPPGFSSTDDGGTFTAQPAHTTEYELIATNPAGLVRALQLVTVGPFVVDRFEATPATVAPGGEVILTWSVRGHASVVLEGYGPQPQQGSLALRPQYTQVHRLHISAPDTTATVETTVAVSGPPPISFAWSDQEFPGARPQPAPLSPFSVYVVSLDPNGVDDYEFRIDLTDCLLVLNEGLPPGALNLGPASPGVRNYLVEGTSCLFGLVTPLLRLDLLALDQTCLDAAVLQLGATDPSSLDPPSFGYTTCLGEASPFRPGPISTLTLLESAVSASEPDAQVPMRTRLLSNTPNPFNPKTVLRFELAQEGPVVLEIFDAGGRLLRRVPLGNKRAGSHSWTWNGQDDRGKPVSSGIYYSRLSATSGSDVRALALIR